MWPGNIKSSLRSPEEEAPGSSLPLSLQDSGFSALQTHGIFPRFSETEFSASQARNAFPRRSGCPSRVPALPCRAENPLFIPPLENAPPRPRPSSALLINGGVRRFLHSVQRGGSLLCNEDGRAQHSSPEQMEPLPPQETLPIPEPRAELPTHLPHLPGELPKNGAKQEQRQRLCSQGSSPAATEEPLL